MKIVFLAPFGLRPKGTARFRAVPLAQGLIARGHQVTVIVPPWNYPADSGRLLQIGDVPVINVPLPARVPIAWHGALSWRLLRRALAEQPDVVHVFKPKGFAGAAASALWAYKRAGLRTLLAVDTDDWEGKGGWNEREGYPAWQQAVFAWQERSLLRSADVVTVASRALADMAGQLGVPGPRITYVPNGPGWGGAPATAERRSEARARLGLDGPTVLLYTRFFEFDLDRVAAAWRLVAAQVPGARLLVVGKGLFDEDARFLALARGDTEPDRVLAAGWVETGALAPYFAAADIALFPFDDTLLNRTKCPVKLADLMSAGLPVVAERVGQVEEYVEHGVSGWLVASGGVQSLADAAVALLRDGALRQQLGTGAQARMAGSFSWDRLAARLEGAYQA